MAFRGCFRTAPNIPVTTLESTQTTARLEKPQQYQGQPDEKNRLFAQRTVGPLSFAVDTNIGVKSV